MARKEVHQGGRKHKKFWHEDYDKFARIDRILREVLTSDHNPEDDSPKLEKPQRGPEQPRQKIKTDTVHPQRP